MMGGMLDQQHGKRVVLSFTVLNISRCRESRLQGPDPSRVWCRPPGPTPLVYRIGHKTRLQLGTGGLDLPNAFNMPVRLRERLSCGS